MKAKNPRNLVLQRDGWKRLLDKRGQDCLTVTSFPVSSGRGNPTEIVCFSPPVSCQK